MYSFSRMMKGTRWSAQRARRGCRRLPLLLRRLRARGQSLHPTLYGRDRSVPKTDRLPGAATWCLCTVERNVRSRQIVRMTATMRCEGIVRDLLQRLADGKRWVLVAPPGSNETRLLLAKASAPEQVAQIGRQAGGRVFLFLQTDDFWRDFKELTERGVRFREAPRDEPYGMVAVFEDLYGNRWDLLQIKID